MLKIMLNSTTGSWTVMCGSVAISRAYPTCDGARAALRHMATTHTIEHLPRGADAEQVYTALQDYSEYAAADEAIQVRALSHAHPLPQYDFPDDASLLDVIAIGNTYAVDAGWPVPLRDTVRRYALSCTNVDAAIDTYWGE